MKFLKNCLLILIIVAMVLPLASCGEKKVKNADGVVLKWIMPGPGKQQDTDKVMAVFNEKLQEYLPGVTLEIESFPWDEYEQKVLLIQTSGEKVDIINTAPLDFSTEVANGSFYDITELVESECKELKETYVDYIWTYTTIDGKIYGVPSYQGLATRNGLYMPKAMSDKYWDINKAAEVFANNKTMTEECYDVIEEYLKNAEAAGETCYGIQESAKYGWKGYENILDVFQIRKDDESCTVYYGYETPEMQLFYEKMADWYQKGYIRKDVLSSYGDTAKLGKPNGNSMWISSCFADAAESATMLYGMEIDAVPFDDFYIGFSNSAAGANCVSSSCKNPKEAVQFLNLLNTNKELFRLLQYGIEGDHYKLTAENRAELEYTSSPTSSSRYGLWGFVLGNTYQGFISDGSADDYFEYIEDLSRNTQNKSKLIGFVPDTSSFKAELSQITAIKKEFSTALIGGVNSDYKAKYEEFMSKLKLAGLDKVKEELQRQVDEFIANK